MSRGRNIIALDIGNVCVSIHPERVVARLNVVPTPEVLAVCARLECGLISEADWLAYFHEQTQHRFSAEQLISIWNSSLGNPIPGMEEALKDALARGYSFVYLSDISSFHWTEFQRKCPFCHLALDGVFSFDAGVQKPDEKIFLEFERRHGKPCVYFDDRLNNIETARCLGWNAVPFRSVADFVL